MITDENINVRFTSDVWRKNNTNEGRSLWQKTEKQNIMHWWKKWKQTFFPERSVRVRSFLWKPAQCTLWAEQAYGAKGSGDPGRRWIHRILSGKGTFCADVLRQIHGTGNIAVVTTYISDYIFPRLIQGIDEVLSDNGYSIILKIQETAARRRQDSWKSWSARELTDWSSNPAKVSCCADT